MQSILEHLRTLNTENTINKYELAHTLESRLEVIQAFGTNHQIVCDFI